MRQNDSVFPWFPWHQNSIKRLFFVPLVLRAFFCAYRTICWYWLDSTHTNINTHCLSSASHSIHTQPCSVCHWFIVSSFGRQFGYYYLLGVHCILSVACCERNAIGYFCLFSHSLSLFLSISLYLSLRLFSKSVVARVHSTLIYGRSSVVRMRQRSKYTKFCT